ncbi:MAG TPA: LytR C-terminal domain-containing protein [Acidimicrobiales bacterium]|nr:LytR C-terminal domain-containing protein [Acidimicrobiales bacterium]
MDADRPPTGEPASISVVRAAVVLVVFVVAVVALVDVGTRASVSSVPTAAAPTTTTTTTTGHAGGSTTMTSHAITTTTTTTKSNGKGHKAVATTTTTAAPSTVSVVVANATSADGLAAHYTSVISAGGWNMGTPIDANTTEATSAVYYATGEQEAAASIATKIGVQPTAVLPITSATPVSYPTGTDVVVVIGEDLASAPGA